MRQTIQYDLSDFGKFLNQVAKPEELCESLIDLLFNYSMTMDEERAEIFKNDVGTIYLLYSEFKRIKPIA